MRKLLTKKTLFVYIILLTLIAMTTLQSCKPEGPKTATVTFISGKAELFSKGEKAGPLKLRYLLKKGEIIKTGKKSQVAVQIGNKAVLMVLENSTATMTSLFKKSRTEIFLKYGSVITKINRMKKGSHYFIRTPTAIAGVRGTRFKVSHSKGESRVSVKKGKVFVVATKINKEQTLNEGKMAIISDSIKVMDISSLEKTIIEKVEAVPYIKGIQGKGDAEYNSIMEDLKKKESKIDDKIKKVKAKLNLTIGDLRKKYGRIDVITTYTGKVIKGVIVKRGKKSYTVLTPSGKRRVNKMNVRNTRVQ